MESTSHAQGGIGLLARGAGREHEHVIADLDSVGLVAHGITSTDHDLRSQYALIRDSVHPRM